MGTQPSAKLQKPAAAAAAPAAAGRAAASPGAAAPVFCISSVLPEEDEFHHHSSSSGRECRHARKSPGIRESSDDSCAASPRYALITGMKPKAAVAAAGRSGALLTDSKKRAAAQAEAEKYCGVSLSRMDADGAHHTGAPVAQRRKRPKQQASARSRLAIDLRCRLVIVAHIVGKPDGAPACPFCLSLVHNRNAEVHGLFQALKGGRRAASDNVGATAHDARDLPSASADLQSCPCRRMEC